MSTHRIYSVTSIGRPVDLKYRTNRAMVIGLAPAAVLAVVTAVLRDYSAVEALGFVLSVAVAGFGGWAMGRELDPDHQAAAFVSMAGVVVTAILLSPAEVAWALLVLITTLGLVRQVNRTTGLEARMSDSVILMVLTLVVTYGTANAFFPLAAAVSYALDGYLRKPLRRQIVFALLALGATVVYMVDHDVGLGSYSAPQSLAPWLAALFAVWFGLNIALRKRCASRCDVGSRSLDVGRVRGGMLVAVVVVVQGLPSVAEIALVSASVAGVCISSGFRRSFRTPKQ